MMVGSSWKVLPILLLSIQQSLGHERGEPHISRRFHPDYIPRTPWYTDTVSTTRTVRPVTRPPIELPRLKQCVERNLPIKVNFTRIGLKSIGDNFVESSKVTEMYLGHNNISEVSPFSFSSLPELQVLDMSANNISISKLLQLDKHNRLQKLIIDDNKCKESDTDLEHVSVQLSGLQELSLRRSCISRFAVNLKMFAPRLLRLYLSGNRIKSSEFLDHLPNTLSRLYIDDNLISNVKGSVLKSVDDLSVSKNKIEELCGTSCDNSNSLALNEAIRLQKLNASHNEISKVTEDAFESTSGLVHLDLSNNKITVLPDKTFEGLASLEKLNMSHNSLTSIPNVCFLNRMKLLDLRGNQIGAIFKTNFCSRPMYLETLLLANNRIDNVDSEAFASLQSLRKLDLSNNLIVTFPMNVITFAKSLEIFLLKNNSIANLDGLYTVQSTSFRELHLQDNPLLHLKVGWVSSKYLSNLIIHLKELPLNNDRTVDNGNALDNAIVTDENSWGNW